MFYPLLLALMSFCLMMHNINDANMKWDPTKPFFESGKVELFLTFGWSVSCFSWFIEFITLLLKR